MRLRRHVIQTNIVVATAKRTPSGTPTATPMTFLSAKQLDPLEDAESGVHVTAGAPAPDVDEPAVVEEVLTCSEVLPTVLIIAAIVPIELSPLR